MDKYSVIKLFPAVLGKVEDGGSPFFVLRGAKQKQQWIWAKKKFKKHLCIHEQELWVLQIFSRAYFMEFNLYRKDVLASLYEATLKYGVAPILWDWTRAK